MNNRIQAAIALLAAAFIMASINALADDSNLTVHWSTGFEVSSGTYGGSEDIEDLYVPMTARVDYERLSFALTVPYLSVRAPAGTIVTSPGDEPVSGAGQLTTESGLGDIIASVTAFDVFYSARHDISLDLTGQLKLGTADDSKGLGTGEQDFTLRADLLKFYDRVTLMGSAGYKLRGDPAGLDLENTALGSVGGVYSISRASRVGLVYDYRESALQGGDAVSEVSVFLSRRLNDAWRVQVYGFTGFGDSSADWGAGILLKIS
ncbi:MAG: hypothetical protein HKN64_07080 [Woeseiaceae bacterium]|nr:hypothetical protein [Woeseiaceae bacterium]